MFQFLVIFHSGLRACVVFVDHMFNTYILGSKSKDQSSGVWRRNELEVRAPNARNQQLEQCCIISKLPPELVSQILRYIPYQKRPPLDMFTSVIAPSTSTVHSLDIASIAAPLVCLSWNALGTAALYKCITIYTESQCVLLQRTLHENRSLRCLIQFLHLPRRREGLVATPDSVLRISASLVEISTHVQGLEVLQQASNMDVLNVAQVMVIINMIL